VGGAHPRAGLAARLPAYAAERGPLPAGAGLQVQRPELIRAEDHLRLAEIGDHLAADDRSTSLRHRRPGEETEAGKIEL